MISSFTVKPITNAILKEFFQSIALLLSLTLFVYVLANNAPGSELHSLADSESVTHSQPAILYFSWLWSCLTGDFGTSLANGLPVLTQVIHALGLSAVLVFSALFFSIVLALAIVAISYSKIIYPLSSAFSFIVNSLSLFPVFWLSYLFIFLFSLWFNRLPVSGELQGMLFMELVIPVMLLSIGSGVVTQMTLHSKNELARVLGEEYILFARAKGASIFHHAVKEGIVFPLLNMISNRIAYLFGTCIIIEQIFNWPGIGRLLWQSAQERDVPMLLCAVLVTAFVIRFVQFGANVIYILLNPRASHR